nr:MAG TPA: hypothetical protein [Caudoviricetes sp.]
MKKYTQKFIKSLVKNGYAVDVTNSLSRKDIPEGYFKVGYSKGVNGINGLIMKGISGNLYAVTKRNTAIHIF